MTAPERPLAGKRLLLIVSGGIAAYKALEFIRRAREAGAQVRCVLTAGGAQFVTPLSLSALSEDKVYSDLFSLTDEAEMGHIRLSREADLIVIAPASADLLAKMAQGLADDLASAVLLAGDKPVLAAPAMNHRMWLNAATQDNIAKLASRGIAFVGPNSGPMACNEEGPGRMAEPEEVLAAVQAHFRDDAPLAGLRALVTSGPTLEPIDPVRFIANRSSGKQGHAIAEALARAGAATTLVSGPVKLSDPPGVAVIPVESAREMLAACERSLPVDIFVAAAAVCDWRIAGQAPEKLKKGEAPPSLNLTENPDILASLAKHAEARPKLVVGFAAETERVVPAAREKLARKGCDWILANDVSPESGTFGGETNLIHFLSADGAEETWPRLTKAEVASRLVSQIADHFKQTR
jgi:phosphopantothenoylcysteine decarboxylase/phosphopantothenate--cysteine ligase